MAGETFKALVAEERDGAVATRFAELDSAELPEGEVTIDVAYSSLNYKDGLALNGNTGRIMRRLPMVPGIDLAGTVAQSDSPEYAVGDKVVATGGGLGETTWGGFAAKARVKTACLVPAPPGLDLRQAMAIGTAGVTAMLSVIALEHAGVAPGEGEVIVTGAAGGVGGVAVALLSGLGYAVAAGTGRAELHEYLRGLGAATIVERAELAAPTERPLESARWAGAIDAVGGEMLAALLRQTRYGGAVAACGNAGGVTLKTTVLPFILRGVSLLGIDSVLADAETRREVWARLDRDLARDKLEAMTTLAPFADLPALAANILAGKVRGRTVIDIAA